MAQVLTCRDGRCATPIGVVNDSGELVIQVRHHSRRHESLIPLEELLRGAVAHGCLSVEQRQRLVAVLEG